MLEQTARVISAYVGNHAVGAADLPNLIGEVHKALHRISEPLKKADPNPAVPIHKSVGRDRIVCLEDGKKFKSLKRHLSAHFGMTPDDYRKKWGLPGDYPMVAPAYSEQRTKLAKDMGLGLKKAPTKPQRRRL